MDGFPAALSLTTRFSPFVAVPQVKFSPRLFACSLLKERYVTKQFADDAGKKGGKFYPPKGVAQLVDEALDPRPA